jgi:hypothetical protein
MKIVQGFLGGLPDFGVLLPESNVGDLKSPPSPFEVSGPGLPAMEESAAMFGDEVEAPRSGVLAPPSREPRSFLSFLPFCLGCLSDEGVEAPLSLEEASAAFSPGAFDGGVEGVDLLTR